MGIGCREWADVFAESSTAHRKPPVWEWSFHALRFGEAAGQEGWLDEGAYLGWISAEARRHSKAPATTRAHPTPRPIPR